ncbi:hypothetical protein KJ763_00145, partial [Patescibacteria group bacterium]|nr:hypothetical protein [Patescibacteria group bacterium]
VGVVPRLIDMEVDPFLIAPTLLMAIGQRLVRVLCPDSKKEIPIAGPLKEKLVAEIGELPAHIKKNFDLSKPVYQGVPSATCAQGSLGRTGVFEILVKTPQLENIILTNPTEPEIIKEARRQGMLTMREAGILKILKGEVGIEELNKL